MKKSGRARIITPLLFVLVGFALFQWAVAGDLNPLSGPSDSGSAMYTLDDIYNRLADNTIGAKRSGGFEEPTAAPGATGHTLDDIYNIAIPTQVPVTGQTTRSVYYTTVPYGHNADAIGDDGDLQAGIPVPSPRFTDNGDGTVTDSLTGLIWLKNASSFNGFWGDCLSYANNLSNGSAGLTDGSSAGDWRIPNMKELLSLIDYGKSNPCLPNGHPFSNVNSDYYWSGTTYSSDPSYAWGVSMNDGQDYYYTKAHWQCDAWPVRDKN
jgi:hypothetical protein